MKRATLYLAWDGPDLERERRLLRTEVLPWLTAQLARRAVELELVELAPAEAPLDGMAAELTGLADDGAFLLCVLGTTYGPVVERLPLEVEAAHPALVPYEGSSRLELVVRYVLALPPPSRARFAFRSDPQPTGGETTSDRLAALKRTVRLAGVQPVDSYRLPGETEADLAEFGRAVLASLWTAVLEREPMLPELPSVRVDENVQFTVFRPRSVRPDEWYDLLAFAHLAERRPDAPADEPDPLAAVRAQAAQLLGERIGDYDDPRSDSRQAVPHEGELTFLPVVPGVEFNPERRVFGWREDVHREEFRLRAGADLAGRTARGRLTVYLGAIILAEVELAIRVDADAPSAARPAPPESSQAHPYRRIFASYSHRDAEIVRQFELLARSLGDEYLRDVVRLHAGTDWDAEILRLIDDADIFQLFWSSNSMASPHVQREYEYALGLNRDHFVRPTYWEDPLPASQQPERPPAALRRLHFHRITADHDRGGPQEARPALGVRSLAAGPPTGSARSPAPPAPAPTYSRAPVRDATPRPAPTGAYPTAAPPPTAAHPRRGLRTVAAPLAVAVLAVAAVTTYLAAYGRPPVAGQPPAATSAPLPVTSPSATPLPSTVPTGGPTETGASGVRLVGMSLAGATLASGPRLAAPVGPRATYAVAPGSRVRVVLQFANRGPRRRPVLVGSALSCTGADGREITLGPVAANLTVAGDPGAQPGRTPVTTWTGAPLTVPADCVAQAGVADGFVSGLLQSSADGGEAISVAVELR